MYADPPQSNNAYSYYPDDEFQHYYKWSSPLGVIKIMCIIIIIMSITIFVCVASTLAWDNQYGLAGFTGIGGTGSYGSYGSYGGYGGGIGMGGYGYGSGSAYGYGGIGGNYTDPRTAKGFMIAMAAVCFIMALVVFILVISKQKVSKSRKFYLGVIITCAIMILLMFVATIVYLVGINPMSQSTGSIYNAQIMGLCAQYQTPMQSGMLTNEYLYHYCVVDPQEAVAIVLGFLVIIGLIIMLVFAVKTRRNIIEYGKSGILWEKVKVVSEESPPHVEEWVNNVSAEPDAVLSDYPDNFRGSAAMLDDDSYTKPPYSDSPSEPEFSLPMPYGTSSGAESGDELDYDELESEFPPITKEQDRLDYKREFDRDHQEYKKLQVELDDVNKSLAEVDRDLDELEEGSPQYLVSAFLFSFLLN
ncbi:OCLN protein, partial [Amia calva]|nr:OCLN protein [Amia calva]